MDTASSKWRSVLRIIGIALLVEFVLFGAYRVWALYTEKKTLEKNATQLELTLHTTEAALQYSHQKNLLLTSALTAAQDENRRLGGKVTELVDVVGDLSGEVGDIQKLRAIDPELLKKYSKVYFLSENYIPSKLTLIDTRYLSEGNEEEYIHARVKPFLERMLAAAEAGGITLQIVSAYRSFDEQMEVKTGYKVLYGSGANQFSADQGYSEHQLGSTVDITATEVEPLSLSFEKSPEYKWLVANAYKFGFALSYPKGNAYYQYEPWHWRFVGVGLATELHDAGKNFYDLTQREIDTRLIKLFD